MTNAQWAYVALLYLTGLGGLGIVRLACGPFTKKRTIVAIQLALWLTAFVAVYVGTREERVTKSATSIISKD